jgi:hypothetical protein
MVRREARGREGRQDTAALHYCYAIAFLEVSEFQQLLHGAITPQYANSAVTEDYRFSRIKKTENEGNNIQIYRHNNSST